MTAWRIRSLAIFFIGTFVGAIFSTAIAFAWTGPTGTAPNSNVSAPVNVGTTDQVKNAGLSLNSLAVFGNAILSGTTNYLNFGTISGTTGYGIRNNSGTLQFKNSGGAWAAFATTSSAGAYLPLAGGTMTSGATINNTNGGIYSNYSEIVNSSEPTINFHRPGIFATGIKLRGDNRLWFGGWSAGDGAASIVAGSITSTSGGYTFPNGTVQTTAAAGVSNYTYATCALSSALATCVATCPAGWYRSGCGGVGNNQPSGNGCYCWGAAGTCYAYCVL